MGFGGWIVLVLTASIAGYILAVEKPFGNKNEEDSGELPPGYIPKTALVLEKAPEEMTERLTPPWQAGFEKSLETEGYLTLGSFSYSAGDFFWARVYLSPDKKTVFLLVNWLVDVFSIDGT